MDVLHQSERTRVTRLVFPDGTLIRKEPLGPDGEKKRRHELAALERLSGVHGVVQLAGKQQSRGSILLEDVHGEVLAGVAKPLDAATLTALAVELARVVAAVHERGVTHRDINPGNIVLTEKDRLPVVIDFALATTSAQLRLAFTHHTEIVGTLPYLAPEQTGRIRAAGGPEGRSVRAGSNPRTNSPQVTHRSGRAIRSGSFMIN